jgi:cell cycle related kinase
MSLKDYHLVKQLGEGTFGAVFAAIHKQTGAKVAIKRIRIRKLEEGIPASVLREASSLARMQGASLHVVQLYDWFPHQSSVILVTERLESDLHALMKAHVFSLPTIKCLMTMLLTGVRDVHRSKLMHRDLKPANLLLTNRGVLKIGDLGLARTYTGKQDGQVYSHEVATRWYRAPELLFGSRSYGQGVDLWACGCIFGELLAHGCPLFPGEHDIDQLYRVMRHLGVPHPDNWPGLASLPDYKKVHFPQFTNGTPEPLETLFAGSPPSAIALLKAMLTYDPEKRISAEEALKHDFFFTSPFPSSTNTIGKLLSDSKQKRAKHDPLRSLNALLPQQPTPPALPPSSQPNADLTALVDMPEDDLSTKLRNGPVGFSLQEPFKFHEVLQRASAQAWQDSTG